MSDQSLPEVPRALRDPAAYPHPVDRVETVETHISWVFLAGDYAYKLKKPVDFGFVDFSTLERRARFCHEELRCNRRFAPELYLDVVRVEPSPGGPGFHITEAAPEAGRDAAEASERSGAAAAADGLERAVRMRRFDGDQELDRLVERGAVDADALHAFGVDLARRHGALPRVRPEDEPVPPLEPVLDNFQSLRATTLGDPHRDRLDALEARARDAWRTLAPLSEQRLRDGFVRECHGDLHLTNLVRTRAGIRAFDCLEFNADLRRIDVVSDVAFLVMDLEDRGRGDLASAFLDGWLDTGGDYEGLRLLRFFQAYRAGVRAKVAALRHDGAEAGDPARDEAAAAFRRHLAGAEGLQARSPGTLILLCGLSGSGKSVLARALVPRLRALRLRTDVARRGPALADGAADARSGAGGGAEVDAGPYAPEARAAVYDRLGNLARDLLAAGETVLVDGTFLTRAQRRAFLGQAGVPAARRVVLHCTAGVGELRRRVRERLRSGRDPSEADEDVLEAQLAKFEAPVPREAPTTAPVAVIVARTDGPAAPEPLAARVARALVPGRAGSDDRAPEP